MPVVLILIVIVALLWAWFVGRGRLVVRAYSYIKQVGAGMEPITANKQVLKMTTSQIGAEMSAAKELAVQVYDGSQMRLIQTARYMGFEGGGLIDKWYEKASQN